MHRVDTVHVPETDCPFLREEELDVFADCLQTVLDNGFIPEGFGLLDGEYDDGYPPRETIPYGQRGKRELTVDLPHSLWFGRAVMWAQAVYTLESLFGEE